MKLFMKKFLAVTLTVTLILSGTVTAFGADSNAIKVQFNGEAITFAGTAKIVDGKVMVPFRQTLESMGADVSYDLKTNSMKVKTADKEVPFKVGGDDLVSVRFIAESLGYSIGWDAVNKTVVIIDPATLFANADADFSIISKLMKSDLDLEKAYETTGQFDMDITTYADPQSIMPGMDFSVSGKMSGIQQKSNADLVMSLAFQFDKMLSKLTAEEKTQMEPLLNMFKNANMKIKMDGETGITYMNSSLFSAIDPTVGANTWYKMNVYDTYEEMGIDLKSISNMSYSDVKLSEMLTASFSSMEYADTATYQDMKTTYTFLKNLIGDGAFTRKTTGSYVTYTLNMTRGSVLAALTKTALAVGISNDTMDLTEIGELLNTSKIGANIMIKEKAGSLYEYGLKGSCSLEDVNFSFDMTGDQKNAEGQITIDQKDLVKMMIEVESHITETSTAPDLSLPTDAVVVDYPM